MQEELELICVKCKTRFPIQENQVLTIENAKLNYKNKAIDQLSKLEQREFNNYIKILKHMEPLTITIKLAQKLIESSKVKDFEIRFTSDMGKNLKVSKFQFTTEGLPLKSYLESVQSKEASISFKTREKTMTYRLLMEEEVKKMEV